MITRGEALPGSTQAVYPGEEHRVLRTPLTGPRPQKMETAVFGMGCFWGAERLFWQLPGVYSTMVGYAGGYTENPTYEQVSTGKTGHTEVTRVVYDPGKVSFRELLRVFWEGHDPTQGYRQGNDIGTQYRSAIFAGTAEQWAQASESLTLYEDTLRHRGRGDVSTQLDMLDAVGGFYPAEAYHQQYLDRNPGGYCGLQGTGVTCALPAEVATAAGPSGG